MSGPLSGIRVIADVFVQNFRPGAIERMGFAEEVVVADIGS